MDLAHEYLFNASAFTFYYLLVTISVLLDMFLFAFYNGVYFCASLLGFFSDLMSFSSLGPFLPFLLQSSHYHHSLSIPLEGRQGFRLMKITVIIVLTLEDSKEKLLQGWSNTDLLYLYVPYFNNQGVPRVAAENPLLNASTNPNWAYR